MATCLIFAPLCFLGFGFFGPRGCLRSFGSENVPAFVFRNAAFPVLDEEKRPYPGKQIGLSDGPGASRQPYFAKTFFNISGMSYGALSPAAISSGLRIGGCSKRTAIPIDPGSAHACLQRVGAWAHHAGPAGFGSGHQCDQRG